MATAAEAASASADATATATLAALAVVMELEAAEAVVMELEAAEAVAIVVESVVSIAAPCGSVASSRILDGGDDGWIPRMLDKDELCWKVAAVRLHTTPLQPVCQPPANPIYTAPCHLRGMCVQGLGACAGASSKRAESSAMQAGVDRRRQLTPMRAVATRHPAGCRRHRRLQVLATST